MKQIFTKILLAAVLFCPLAVSAETVVFEGSEPVNDWGKRFEIPFTGWSSVPAGAVMHVTGSMIDGAEYAVFHLLDASWVQVKSDISLSNVEGEQTVDVILTETILASAVNGGLGIQGVGFNLKKITIDETVNPEPVVPDLEPAVLWSGEQTVDGWGASSLIIDKDNNSESLALFNRLVDKACNLYILVVPGTDDNIRISGQWSAWGETAFPSDGFNHNQNKDADNVIKVTLTDDFVNKAFAENGGMAVWGSGGFIVKRIATTKEAAMTSTGINGVSIMPCIKRNDAYNIMGQKVAANRKGIIIENGKKIIY